MNLNDYSKMIVRPMLLDHIERGLLDNVIQSEDCQDIINADVELKIAVEKRLNILKNKC